MKMAKYKITTLSPVHIGSGKEYELNYNMLYEGKFVYIYDEFKLAEFFISKNIEIPTNLTDLKTNIKEFKDEIIASNSHLRKISLSFSEINKPLLEQVSSQNNPIITGSSMKGAIRTAILDCLYERANNDIENCKCETIFSSLRKQDIDENRFQRKGKNIEAFDKDFANIFKYLKVSDNLNNLDTKIFKTINMKKDENHQNGREEKTKSLINLAECIGQNQTFEVTIDDISGDKLFRNIGTVCNKFYIPWYKDELSNYFRAPMKAEKETFVKLKNLSNNCFLINIGRFGGAERKSINNLRYIKNSKAYDKTTTTARTYALEESIEDETYYKKELLPFGWLLCELVDDNGVQ